MNEQETSLLARLRAGEPGSFEELVRAHSPRLLATASRILGDEHEAQDIVQDALVSAWKGMSGFEGASSLYTWLHRIVVNACLAFLRTPRARSEIVMRAGEPSKTLACEGIPAAWSEPGPSLEKRIAMRQAIQRALKLIPEDFRIVLLLRDVEELSSREAAERLGIPDTAVRQRLHRARAAMAELLRPELCDGPELTCGGRLDLLMDYIDNALPAELQAPVHEHIEGCAACGHLRDTYRATIGIPRAVASLTAFDIDAKWMEATLSKAGA